MATLKEFLAKKPKIRKCPHCKSTQGFEMRYLISGNGSAKINFKGIELDSERETFDRIDNTVECLNCGKSFDAEFVQHLIDQTS